MHKILSKRELAQGTVVENEIEAPRIAAKAKPGQFIILRVNETGERIPLTMADSDPKRGTITIIYQVVGKTTALLKSLEVMDSIMDIAGPLGTPTPIENKGTVICVGGGTGVAVLHPITRGMHQAGNKVIGIIGARTKDLLIMEDKMEKATDELYVCTDDGSYGHHGFVTDVLREQLTKLGSAVKEAVCIGPVPMMKFCCAVTKEFGVPTMVSLNAIMVDGTGMCGCCRVQVGEETKFACVDGPEFNGHKVDFDGLSKRLTAYTPQEKEAMNLYEKKCACETQG
ncbi:MAG: sulfide/dihydroorotate dehydrogenase-like FAD/NAD-binding protein [Desulfarculaceae bacterium]|nr:sulfide/dihydroorotate dehydrogenase-like FAD/NAD-binding protein [Desulfarculaceae bacterium]MCF8071232.1 sulfide/dihydroorotate dehydrogenase-like FAD/NAD-binding protein [Desulfarculaceae bacterium]MCF8101165.1 sulfide/dihydroorotate dehydrogenase-like FAD/NAD-binding protein [Desulfarculaceae bacterium]MCF8115286.1 sulfide/dihydroorotate dehydrogenase-like FAD/NAD-binding protein [Desulfarculaceae bacterium]